MSTKILKNRVKDTRDTLEKCWEEDIKFDLYPTYLIEVGSITCVSIPIVVAYNMCTAIKACIWIANQLWYTSTYISKGS